jgi:hypothetical protein
MFAFTKLMQAMSGALPYVAEYIIVGGGAGGSGGGGGAGGLLEGTIVLPSGAYAITIGGGGAAGRQVNTAANGGVGNPTNLGLLIAYGGGYGAGSGANGGPGGSGGGASAGAAGSFTGGTATSGQGNAGGNVTWFNGWAGGGGGGAGGAGGNAAGWDTGSVAPYGPPGGAGKSSSITGTATTYAAGGQAYWSDTVSANAPANLGGGGGGSQTKNNASDGWAGGSGIVVIAFPNTFPAATLSGLTYNEPTRAGYRVYRITGGSGTFTFN